MVTFIQLNHGWNADPNAPEPILSVDGSELLLQFYVNALQFPEFVEGSSATVRFKTCNRYRLGPTNDEGWYLGQCRFSRSAPSWGEFYQITGDPELLLAPTDWRALSAIDRPESKHYLFYFRDETFECLADSWEVELPPNTPSKPNPLLGSA